MNRSALAIAPFFLACSDYSMHQVKQSSNPAQEEEQLIEADGTGNPSDDCAESSSGFDIEQVSTLQDAFGLPHVRDGLMLEIDSSTLSEEETWRPISVEVLVMFPDWYFDYYDDSNTIQVHIYDNPDPSNLDPYSLSKRIIKNELDWQPITLPNNADWSGDNLNQIGAWVEFDFSDITPFDGFYSLEYFVAVEWDSMGFPNVGYSNFELNCPQNWTDYGDGSWRQNTGNDCSWPMLKIEKEVRNPGNCEE